MNSIRPGLNKARATADAAAAAVAADVFSSIASMLEGVKDFANLALKSELAGGDHYDEAARVIDATADARGTALEAESKVTQ